MATKTSLNQRVQGSSPWGLTTRFTLIQYPHKARLDLAFLLSDIISQSGQHWPIHPQFREISYCEKAVLRSLTAADEPHRHFHQWRCRVKSVHESPIFCTARLGVSARAGAGSPSGTSWWRSRATTAHGRTKCAVSRAGWGGMAVASLQGNSQCADHRSFRLPLLSHAQLLHPDPVAILHTIHTEYPVRTVAIVVKTDRPGYPNIAYVLDVSKD